MGNSEKGGPSLAKTLTVVLAAVQYCLTSMCNCWEEGHPTYVCTALWCAYLHAWYYLGPEWNGFYLTFCWLFGMTIALTAGMLLQPQDACKCLKLCRIVLLTWSCFKLLLGTFAAGFPGLWGGWECGHRCVNVCLLLFFLLKFFCFSLMLLIFGQFPLLGV